MNRMIKPLLSVLAVFLLCQCKKDEPKPDFTITDNNFLEALIENGLDTNGDGIISTTEAEKRKYLNVSGYGISDMTGIEAFVNLDSLDCSDNKLTTLDISNNIAQYSKARA